MYIFNVVLRTGSSLEVILGPRDLPEIKQLNKYDFNDQCIISRCENCKFYKATDDGWRCCEFRTIIIRMLQLFPLKE